MCLIIQRQPNFEIPYEKFSTAVLNNPDGYGLSFPDDKGLTVLRSSDKPDVDALYRMVNEELIDKELMVHLRYTTAGDTILRNSHPFPILEKSRDGIDLRMAHNGTLHKYKNGAAKWESDTRNFVRSFVRPLFKRLVRGMPSEEILQDEFVKKILEDQLTTQSVLTFLDSEGNSLICNETGNGGKKEEGWYYSNVYSFDKKHREPTPKVSYISDYSNSTGSYSQLMKDCNVQKFTKKRGYTVQQLYKLTDPTIDTLVDISPEDTKLLIKELLFECQRLDKDNTRYRVALNKTGGVLQ